MNVVSTAIPTWVRRAGGGYVRCRPYRNRYRPRAARPSPIPPRSSSRRHDHVVPARAADDSADGRHGGIVTEDMRLIERFIQPVVSLSKPIAGMRRMRTSYRSACCCSPACPAFAQERRWTLKSASRMPRAQYRKSKHGAHGAGASPSPKIEVELCPDLRCRRFIPRDGRVLDETTYEFVWRTNRGGQRNFFARGEYPALRRAEELLQPQTRRLDLRSSLLAVEKMRNDVR